MHNIGVLCVFFAFADGLLSNPEKFGFSKRSTPYADWKKCVFFNGVPMDLLEMGGYFERNVCNMLFKGPHRLVRLARRRFLALCVCVCVCVCVRLTIAMRAGAAHSRQRAVDEARRI